MVRKCVKGSATFRARWNDASIRTSCSVSRCLHLSLGRVDKPIVDGVERTIATSRCLAFLPREQRQKTRYWTSPTR